jgi:hypothetical protein
MTLHRVDVILSGRTLRPILVTGAQLAKLNRLPLGTEVFLSRFYCYRGGDCRVIRTKDGLQWVPSPYGTNADDLRILEELAW